MPTVPPSSPPQDIVVVTFLIDRDATLTARVRDVRTQARWTVTHAADLHARLVAGRDARTSEVTA